MNIRSRSGFTLIELLIVIALLGSLAVALLAAIDPFEQFKKGTDTGTRNTVQEFYNASIRYYAQRTGWPSSWAVTGTTPVGPANLAEANATTYISPLVNAGELKANFIELAQDQLANISMNVRASTLMVCYIPTSKSFQSADKNTKYTSNALNATGNAQSDTAGTVCKLNGGTTDCYWCVY